MADTDNQSNQKFELSYAFSDDKSSHSTAVEAGKAFADADGKLAPRVIVTNNNGARTMAKHGRENDTYFKQVFPVSEQRTETDVKFWTAYHDRVAEKNRSLEPSEPSKQTPPVMKLTLGNAPEGSAEPGTPQPDKSHDERFAMPPSFEERFILTREAQRQEMFRSYDDKRPAITDSGDILKTKNADRSTAMDMIELAAHRGWTSLKVKGPEDFRREMWIEGTAQGIDVQGYRPNEKDRTEAQRRAELIGERVIERTDQGKTLDAGRAGTSSQPESQAKSPSNVVPMIDYKRGLEGKVSDIGTAPYRDREGASVTPYVAMELADGRSHKLWGVALPDMIDKHQLKVGDKATIHDNGQKAVTVKERDPKTGVERDKETFRREWGARDIERAPERAQNRVVPIQKLDEAVIESPVNAKDKASGDEKTPPVNAKDKVPGDEKTPPVEAKEETQTVKRSPPVLAKKEDSVVPENSNGHRPAQERHTDRLEQRLTHKDAARDPALKGAASTIAVIDAEMRAAGVPEKDRQLVRDLASNELAKGIRAGRQYDVQKLPNVSASQQAAAKALTTKDVSKIIEQARVRTPPKLDATGKSATQNPEQARERAQQQDRGRDR